MVGFCHGGNLPASHDDDDDDGDDGDGIMPIASCTIDFFIKMTICHFPQFCCSMSVPPHSLLIYTLCITQGVGRRAQGRLYCRGVLHTRVYFRSRGMMLVGHQTFPVGTGSHSCHALRAHI